MLVNEVVVVGGGTAGWMTASYLKAAFADRVSVTVVESDRVPTIGVGEATFSTVRHFFDYLGLKESEWMPACNATYKLGIRFQDWTAPGQHFHHPFERLRVVDGFPLTDWWLHRREHGGADGAPRAGAEQVPFDRDNFLIGALVDAQRSPRHLDGTLFEDDLRDGAAPGTGGYAAPTRSTLADQTTQFPYAYHFDAALLARFLTEYGTSRGVRHVLDDVLGVDVDETGRITGVRTAEHGELTGQLFIDCTGFRGLLINQALGEPFVSYQDTLPNDRAVALRVPVDVEQVGIRPCTTATAQAAGWTWTIPLFDRIGTGYVYASDYCTPEEAERTLREFVGPAAADLEANHIRMRIGRTANSWVGNCVAIGLSSGFVEPLESTGIFFIQHAIEQLVRKWPRAGEPTATSAAYNRAVNQCMDGVREFLVLHYRAAARADNDYWRDAKTRPAPDSLLARQEQWAGALPDAESIPAQYHGFEAYSWVCMLLGLAGTPLRAPAALALMPTAAADREFAQVRATGRRLVETLPSQYEYLAQLHG